MSNIVQVKNETLRDAQELIKAHRPEKWEPWPTSSKSKMDSSLLMYGTALTVIVGSLAVAATGVASAPVVISGGLVGGVASGISVFLGHKILGLASKAYSSAPAAKESIASSILDLKIAGQKFSAALGVNPGAKSVIEDEASIKSFLIENYKEIFDAEYPQAHHAKNAHLAMLKIIEDVSKDKLQKGDHAPISINDIERVIERVYVPGANKILSRAMALSGMSELKTNTSIFAALSKKDVAPSMEP